LPCGDVICREHLSERSVVKENKIKCTKCNQDFQVKHCEFKSNNELKNLIESRSYLRSIELKLKQKLEELIRKFFQIYDEFIQNKSILEFDVFEHFQEMRFQIDLHRAMLKEKSDEIDEIAMAMINDTEKYEVLYLKNIKEDFSSFDDCKSLEHELNQIEELFRDPNLLIETIKDMEQKQEEVLNDIQFKLNQMTIVKDTLIATNYFQSTLAPINQEEETSLFGSIRLNACWSNVNSFKGQILTDVKQSIALLELCEYSPRDKWSLLYRGTRDGFGSNDFHSKCNGKSNTLTILKAEESKFIFGGFTSVSWESPVYGEYKSDPSAFIFSLTNKDNKPLKMKKDPNGH
jgi:hypothetical protein